MLGNPVCYRDGRTEGMPEEFFLESGRKGALCRIGYAGHGYQYLVSVVCHEEGRQCAVEGSRQVAFHARPVQLLPYGSANNEYSIASTSELLDAKARTWNFKLIRELGLPEHLFGEVVMPGTSRGFFETGNQGTDRNRLRGRSDCCSFARYGQCG